MAIWKKYLSTHFKKPVAALFNDQPIELDFHLKENGNLEILTESDPSNLWKFLITAPLTLWRKPLQDFIQVPFLQYGPAIKEAILL
ncbi:hypothetical protein ACEW7V_03445 [Areca yellow leaf disease phytoplasma]|uniref:hypothetical protein n=1 Tax=Areca yellow leaf disease phytoplasma TaxID=927614 RepID=UPI0035B54D12